MALSTSMEANHASSAVSRPTSWLSQVALTPFQVTVIATILSGVLLSVVANRIDFHADEAIYMSAIPLSTRTDTGLCFSLPYLAIGGGAPTPLSARFTSMLFGLALIFSTTRSLQILAPRRAMLIGWLMPLATAASFHGMFAILRVRPEISWFAVTSVIAWCLIELRHKDRMSFRMLLLASLLVLPMNHLLCMFACFFLGIWFVFFGTRRFGVPFSIVAIGMMGLGVILNTAIRAYLVTGELQLIPQLGSGASGPGMHDHFPTFLRFMYWVSPLFLCDQAVADNWWQCLFPKTDANNTLHAVVGMRPWGLVLFAPLLMRSKESFFLASVPLLTAVLFFVSNYYNATYMPIIGLYAMCIFMFQLTRPKSWRLERMIAVGILVITLLNGASFLTTRIFRHGPATYFAVEERLREEVSKYPPGSKIAVAERFQPAVDAAKYERYILFKDSLPEDLDCVLLDNYDFEMYRFIPVYDELREQIDRYADNYEIADTVRTSTYYDEPVFEEAKADHPDKTVQGAWFFRHSITFRVSVLVPGEPGEHIAQTVESASADTQQR